MSFEVKKLTVGKGRTTTSENDKTWQKTYFQLEVEILDEHQIELARKSVESLIDGWLNEKAVEPAATKTTEVIEQTRQMFPENLAELLSFTEQQNSVVIKPLRYLGSENFAKIVSIIGGAGGEYVSAGKQSHFRVPKTETKTETSVPQFNHEELMEHEGWKGKKTGRGEYAKGSLSWGWDWRDSFSESVIQALEKTTPLIVGDYEFTLTEKIVQTKKIKK